MAIPMPNSQEVKPASARSAITRNARFILSVSAWLTHRGGERSGTLLIRQ
jgi:hypothetical protein